MRGSQVDHLKRILARSATVYKLEKTQSLNGRTACHSIHGLIINPVYISVLTYFHPANRTGVPFALGPGP